MGNYIVRRLIYAVVTLVGVSFISFLIVYAVPADPAAVIAGPNADASAIANIRHQWGLDRPFIAQYGTYFFNLLRGDWGTSFFNQLPVLRQLLGRFPATAQLGLIAFLLQLLIGIPLGAWAAIRQNTRTDHLIMSGVLVGLSLPRFWLGVILLFLFALKLPWFPLGGYGGLSHVVLPAITVGVTGAAYYTRLLRSSMIEVKRQDYVLAATAKGISRARVQVLHVMRNSLIPVVTWAGMDLAAYLGGLIIVETVFGWPGIGQLTFQAIKNMDIPLISGTVLLSAIFVVIGSLVVDIVYVFLDPRISYE
jgi:peptide/nickel transport system permease protein